MTEDLARDLQVTGASATITRHNHGNALSLLAGSLVDHIGSTALYTRYAFSERQALLVSTILVRIAIPAPPPPRTKTIFEDYS